MTNDKFHTMSIEELYKIYQQYPTISTDSRNISKGCLFFALKGANFDGNQYAKQAIELGAAYAIIDDFSKAEGIRYIVVEDVLKTLQQLAHYHRQQFEIPIIAITGSNGKTTTKELVSAVMTSHYPTHYTKGNFNNHIGVPLTLLRMPAETEVAIIEMGANHIGEIGFLCEIAAPTHGTITNVGSAHLEGFGSLEGIRIGKGELYRYLENHRGVAFLNSDEEHLLKMAGWSLPKIFYQSSDSLDPEKPGFECQLLETLPFLKVGFLNEQEETLTAESQLMGAYNFNNIMTAIAVGKYFKVPPSKIQQAIEQYTPSNNRSQLKKIGTNSFLLDAYNANPSSMEKALESFATYPAQQKMAIIGDMLELGKFSVTAHRDILSKANQLGIKVVTVGKEFLKVATPTTQTFINVDALKQWFKEQNFEDTFFLLKGSRGIKLEKLLEA